MKKNSLLILLSSVLLFALGCGSTSDTSKPNQVNHRTSISDSGFAKFDPSAMDSNPQKRKKVIRIISRSERYKEFEN